ncbi:MAG: hypothetical protein PHT59_07370 [Candidatus Omnitrophica bacterium]|nr:hypothetical protein [Candidatus Omnitrophota bacterium]
MRGKAERILHLLFKDKEKIERIFRTYIHHRNLYSKGIAEMAFWKGLFFIQPYLVWWVSIKVTFPSFPLWIFVFIAASMMILKIIIGWIIGWWWDKQRLYDRENDWNNRRNPVLDGLDKKVLGGKDERPETA